MTELFLKFKEEDGKERRIAVDQDKFTVGRGSDCDLSIVNNSLSRVHISIERFADVFIVSDCNSSNGTKLNGKTLSEPTGLKTEDILNLGDSFEIVTEMVADTDSASFDASSVAETPSSRPNVQASAESSSQAISPMYFLLLPLFFLFVVVAVFIGFFALSPTKQVAENRDVFIRSDEPKTKSSDDEEIDEPTPKPSKTEPTKTPASNSAENSPTTQPTAEISDPKLIETPKINTELDKVERNAYAFMRKIAANDSNPVLTNPQLQVLSAKINQLKASSSLRDNLKSARQGKSSIESLARERNLLPQFLATAAMANLGSNRGDVSSNAGQIRDTLNELRESVGNNLADDCLLMMAAYSEGASGDKSKMRDRLAQATKGSQLSARQIRTIWFLKESGKISDTQFDLAIRFLAIGTISQNPKDFGVSEEPLIF
jgi:pSer/pThr/pTyr-binding forkhead associated (FHA) protein